MHSNRLNSLSYIVALTLIVSITRILTGTPTQAFSIDTTTTVITFPGSSGPLNTGVFVHQNEIIKITASGEIDNGLVKFTPDGGTKPPNPAYGATILPNIATNSLVGSIGDFSTGTLLDDGLDVNPSGKSGTELGYPGLFGPGYVGSYFVAVAQTDGNIYLAFNDNPLYDNSGSFTVSITILPIAYSISGRISDVNNIPIQGVKVSTDKGDYTYTNSSGVYTIMGLPEDVYTLTATVSGLGLWPGSRKVNVPPNVAQQDFYEWECGLDQVPLYLQGDPSTPSTLPNHPSWYNDEYGNYPEGDTYNTVGRWGCNMSSGAMILSYFGGFYQLPFTTDPGILNTWLRNNNGYDQDNGVIYSSISDYAWLNGVSAFVPYIEQPNDEKLDEHLCFGNPAMLRVTSAYGTHFVVATGKINVNGESTYTLNDPALGETSLLEDYDNDYQQVYYYMQGPAVYDRSMLEISAHSPVHFVVTDPIGRKSGLDPRTNKLWDEIPDSGYSYSAIAGPDGNTLPESKVLIIPHTIPGEYLVEAIGYASGPYEIIVYRTDYSGNLTKIDFSGVTQEDSFSAYTFTMGGKVSIPFVVTNP